jgi:hypothetical protein
VADRNPSRDHPSPTPEERLEGIVAACGGAHRQAGKETICRCPAHDDENPSLSVRLAEDGSLLVLCRAGCDTAAVVHAIGWQMSDLMAPSKKGHPPKVGSRLGAKKVYATVADIAAAAADKWKGTAESTHVYTDESGKPVFGVVRVRHADGSKDVPQIRPQDGGWVFGGIDQTRPLYRLPELLAAATDVPTCLFEGEQKADLAASFGLVATSCSEGAGKAKRHDLSPLKGRDVVLFPDNDVAGHEHVADIARRAQELGARCVVVAKLPDLDEKGDIVDFVRARRSAGATDEQIAAAIQDAITLAEAPPAGALRQSEDEARGAAPDAPGPSSVFRVVAPPLEWLTDPPPPRPMLLRHPDGRGFLARGTTVVFAGAGGTGKSLAALQLVVAIATGTRWFGHYAVDVEVAGSPARCLILAGEDDELELRQRLFRISEGASLTQAQRQRVVDRVRVVPLLGKVAHLLVRNPKTLLLEESKAAAELRKLLVDEADTTGWDLLVIDPLSRLLGDCESANIDATRAVQLAEALCAAAPGNPATVVLAHSSKLARRASSVDVRGVTGLTDGPRAAWTLRADSENVTEVLLAVEKSNWTPRQAKPLRLQWTADGILQVAEDQGGAATRSVEDDLRDVVEALEREGYATSRDAVAKLAGMKAANGRTAMRIAEARGLVINQGTEKRPRFVVAERRGDPPIPPPDGRDGRSVRPEPAGPAGSPSGVDGELANRRRPEAPDGRDAAVGDVGENVSSPGLGTGEGRVRDGAKRRPGRRKQ